MVTKKGSIQFSKVTPDDVRFNYVLSVECEELGALVLDNSWEELLVALLCVLYTRRPEQFMRRLIEAKILTNDFEVTTQMCIKHTENGQLEGIKLTGIPYYLYYDFSYKTVAFKVKQILNILNINPKKFIVLLEPYSYVEQDNEFADYEYKGKSKAIKLSEAHEIDFNKNKMVAVSILGSKLECKTYTQLLAHMLSYVAIISQDWFKRASKYNKQTTLKIGNTKESVAIRDKKPIRIGKTEYYVNQDINATYVIDYLTNICKEFCINSSSIILYCKEKDFSQVMTGVTYKSD